MAPANRAPRVNMLLTATIIAIVLSVSGEHNFCQGQAMPHEDQERSWRIGVFIDGGTPPSYTMTNSYYAVSANVRLQMYSFGVNAAKSIGAAHGKGIFRGQTEIRAEAIPVWIGHYPSQRVAVHYGDRSQVSSYWKGQDFFGSSITPLIVRRNFNSKAPSRCMPWIQMGAGVLWTNHKFPITMWSAPSSTFNFTPQVGAGLTVFERAKRSVDVGMKIVHISNAGLGDSNPGINQTIMGSIGYSWRR